LNRALSGFDRAHSLQFRLEASNVTNTPHFENPGDTSSNNRLEHAAQP